jgi:hypothetical protein
MQDAIQIDGKTNGSKIGFRFMEMAGNGLGKFERNATGGDGC